MTDTTILCLRVLRATEGKQLICLRWLLHFRVFNIGQFRLRTNALPHIIDCERRATVIGGIATFLDATLVKFSSSNMIIAVPTRCVYWTPGGIIIEGDSRENATCVNPARIIFIVT
jgi:hypothetical protein